MVMRGLKFRRIGKSRERASLITENQRVVVNDLNDGAILLKHSQKREVAWSTRPETMRGEYINIELGSALW